ncbi:hypothetical protein GCM10023149_33490 [Mucilaginibacter gynuensis]|uniref:Uncharacterized protein n=1 Tax=Mucilaginibacter gynuensis TaxID=1302236 RepID=A0ABP8GSL8_9SPHI
MDPTYLFETLALYYSNPGEPMEPALIYENNTGVMRPCVLKKSPNSHFLNSRYRFALELAAGKIEAEFEKRKVPYMRYLDIVDQLLSDFEEQGPNR